MRLLFLFLTLLAFGKLKSQFFEFDELVSSSELRNSNVKSVSIYVDSIHELRLEQRMDYNSKGQQTSEKWYNLGFKDSIITEVSFLYDSHENLYSTKSCVWFGVPLDTVNYTEWGYEKRCFKYYHYYDGERLTRIEGDKEAYRANGDNISKYFYLNDSLLLRIEKLDTIKGEFSQIQYSYDSLFRINKIDHYSSKGLIIMSEEMVYRADSLVRRNVRFHVNDNNKDYNIDEEYYSNGKIKTKVKSDPESTWRRITSYLYKEDGLIENIIKPSSSIIFVYDYFD